MRDLPHHRPKNAGADLDPLGSDSNSVIVVEVEPPDAVPADVPAEKTSPSPNPVAEIEGKLAALEKEKKEKRKKNQTRRKLTRKEGEEEKEKKG